MMVPHLPCPRVDNPKYPGMEYGFVFKNAFFIGLDQNQFEPGCPPFHYQGNDADWIENRPAVRDPSAELGGLTILK